MNRASLRGAALLVITFAAGLLAGGAADRALATRQLATPHVTLPAPDLLDRLDLTADQKRAADSILARSSPRSEAAMREMVPRLAAIADSVNAELAAILTPAQRAKLASMTRGTVFVLKTKDSAGKERIDTVYKR
ncbi:MAG TPA: hypothetical protein VII52_04870 [Gemmatimonadaceae bacterium]